MTTDPVEALETVVQLAKERRKFGSILSYVRRADETDEDTLNRLIQDRRQLMHLCQDLNIEISDPFDPTYKKGPGPAARLRKYLANLLFAHGLNPEV